jgi:hypothetical protein
MRAPKLPLIHLDDQVFAEEGGTEVGAVRQVGPAGKPVIVVYVENAGDFVVPLTAVNAVHDGKVILKVDKLEPALQHALAHAHEREDPSSGRGLRRGS